MSRQLRRACGFSIVELVVVMSLLAILAAIATPMYTEHVRRGFRSEARTTLLESVQWVNRYRTERGSFANAPDEFPSGLRQVASNGAAVYTVALQTTADTFVLTATPVSNGRMQGDVCASLSIDQTGARGFTGDGARRDVCWGR